MVLGACFKVEKNTPYYREPDFPFEMWFLSRLWYRLKKYQPIWISVPILDLNQNNGFSRALHHMWEQQKAGALGLFIGHLSCQRIQISL